MTSAAAAPPVQTLLMIKPGSVPVPPSVSNVCPFMARAEALGWKIPALPAHCVLDSIRNHGAEHTRRCVLRACGLSDLIDGPSLSPVLLLASARALSSRVHSCSPSQRARILAGPFPFADFQVPGEETAFYFKDSYKSDNGELTCESSGLEESEYEEDEIIEESDEYDDYDYDDMEGDEEDSHCEDGYIHCQEESYEIVRATSEDEDTDVIID